MAESILLDHHKKAYDAYVAQWDPRAWHQKNDADGKPVVFVNRENADLFNGPREYETKIVPDYIIEEFNRRRVIYGLPPITMDKDPTKVTQLVKDPPKSEKPYHGMMRPKDQSKPKPQLGDGRYKDGNPKTQFGVVKPGTFETPPIPLYEYSKAHLQGALKYGHYNWRDDPVSISTYMDAAKRHMDQYISGQKVASDTGIHNLAHAMTCLSIIIDAEAYGTLIDDRKTNIDPEGDVLERYFEEGKKHIKQIRDQWTGHAEAVKDGTLEQWKAARKGFA